jgi:hypothetical protein
MQAMRLSRWQIDDFAAGACSLGQDRGFPAKPQNPLHRMPIGTKKVSFLSGDPCGDVLKGMISYSYSFRNASTGVPAIASTSEGRSLASLRRLAKSKIRTNFPAPAPQKI